MGVWGEYQRTRTVRVEADIEQITMFVLLVGYDRYGTESRGKWLDRLERPWAQVPLPVPIFCHT